MHIRVVNPWKVKQVLQLVSVDWVGTSTLWLACSSMTGAFRPELMFPNNCGPSYDNLFRQPHRVEQRFQAAGVRPAHYGWRMKNVQAPAGLPLLEDLKPMHSGI